MRGEQSGVRWGNSVDDLIFIPSTWSFVGWVAPNTAIEASRAARVVVLSKLYPTRSHTGPRREVGAALGNVEEDNGVAWSARAGITCAWT